MDTNKSIDQIFDEQIGRFCEAMQESINELPFVPYHYKQRLSEELDECASKARNSEGDQRSAFNQAYREFHSRFKAKTENELPKVRLS